MKEYYSFKIPEPCHEDWNQMTPSAKGRFCTSCEKTVIDFTNMNRFEIGRYLKEHLHKGVCGHIHKSQLDQVVLKIPAATIHQLRYSSRFFAIALLVVMGTTLMSCKDQYGNKQKIDSVQVVEIDAVLDDSLMMGVMPPPKSSMDSISQNDLKQLDCDTGRTRHVDFIDAEIPITGGFKAPPAPPIVVTATTGEIVAIEGAMTMDHHFFNEVPFAITQKPPEFPDSPANMNSQKGRKYFSDKMNQHIAAHFNKKVLDSTLTGRHKISTQFKIDTTGQVVDIKVKAKHKVLEIEALRVLRGLPNFEPGKDDLNNKVVVRYALPIIFENE